MKILNSYSYSEISTFGGSGEDYFMLIVSPQSSPTTGQRSQLPQENVLEKLMFAMPKLKVHVPTVYIVDSHIFTITMNSTIAFVMEMFVY